MGSSKLDQLAPTKTDGMNKKSVLITGGAGFIGSHLAEYYINKNIKPIVVDIDVNPLSYFYKSKFRKKTYYYQTDICNTKELTLIFKKHKPSIVYHLAAVSEVGDAFDNPHKTFHTNVMGTISVLECCRLTKSIKAIVVASSDKAYGKLKVNRRYVETDPLDGDHPYEVSKAASDHIARMYFKTYGIPVTVSRFGNVYGEGDFHFNRLIPGLLAAIASKKIFQVRSDGTFVRDYIYVKDVVGGYIALSKNIDKTKGEAFNFGSSDTASVIDMIQIVENVLGKKIKYSIINTQKNEIPYQSLNWKKVNKKVGWKPDCRLKNVLSKVYSWHSKYLS